MPSIKVIVLCVFVFLRIGAVSAVPISSKHTSILLPSEDRFYTAPPDYAAAKPGDILRSRVVPGISFAGIIPYRTKAVHQLLFRTTDSLGNASVAVSTIIVPVHANFSRLLSYQTAEDAAWANCAPSYMLQLGSDFSNTGSESAELMLLTGALEEGYLVNIPDYEGITAAYTSGVQAGQATLDSIRAALSSGSFTNISPNAEYQMWGYSGGSLASEWAAELQPTYAPELNFIGTALGGLIPNIKNVLLTINHGKFAGLGVTGINGLAAGYPDLLAYVDEHLKPSMVAAFKAPLTQCLLSDAADFMFEDIFSYFDIGKRILDDPVPSAVMGVTGIMGKRSTPRMPLYIYKSVDDQVSPIADTDALVKKYCSQGAQIQLVRDSRAGHIMAMGTGADGALSFLKDRLDGIPAPQGCTTE